MKWDKPHCRTVMVPGAGTSLWIDVMTSTTT